ncbi:hypothetical protein JCM16161A_10960 [Vulcanisaeta sp. JCM 16161]|uniref:hypothetical protein n=1 Tax=Vulcanisaeta sp. JCM 16161 TaxID=1295372 RepID=UPI000AB03FE4|nr:hypothetical protein [Vulcanisaeta sp. JCM 16161]
MSKEGRRRYVEVIKVELPRDLAERLRRYAAERYGSSSGALSRAVAELIARELGMHSEPSGTVDSIVSIGLQSDFSMGWEGSDRGF